MIFTLERQNQPFEQTKIRYLLWTLVFCLPKPVLLLTIKMLYSLKPNFTVAAHLDCVLLTQKNRMLINLFEYLSPPSCLCLSFVPSQHKLYAGVQSPVC